ncbi:PRC-barrel domain-containing protein [Shouchella clausii]|uniref:PRC-barrel domain-containing protein n=1 Tax=Shouchella clausii TaxID=79880 RepID=UPI000B976950|nr:PRC-barrel domain-containing protein [Shouchella clausii]AST94887.1 hypothetical protein BC8716_02385 [Shouchella clausii]MEB5473343.1 PRC-barrel domain-containing protein [Shouchella clausii]PTL21812.1 PRC-barrel domain containing protein [Shouchella clausii]QNM45327.1 PRC-barrel domain containing protein [Shouchella clausii]WQG95955.1 PRC-barrel domain-containing protein [Shouchella clausii]
MMLIHAKTLEKYTMRATDGELGSLADFYVDGDTLHLRYFVGDTRTWFFGGKVLLSPHAFTNVDKENMAIDVDATKAQIKDSPKPEEHEPINRKYEKELNEHYGWPLYWFGPAAPLNQTYGAGSPASAPLIPPVHIPERKNLEGTADEIRTGADEAQTEAQYQEQTRLFSLEELTGYTIHAKGGKVGKVVDFIIEKADDWLVRYFVVDTGGFLQRELVLVLVEDVEEVAWYDHAILVKTSKAQIESAPAHSREKGLTKDDEKTVYEHYGKTPHWKHEGSLGNSN